MLAGQDQGEDRDRGLPAAAAGDPRRSGLGAPVAIVGMACRFPGGIASPEDLWRLVDEGGDAVSTFPTDRGWDAAELEAGRGGFLADAAGFDAGLFGIPAREALAMDPQQRLLLEVAWEALERAGIDPLSLDGTDAGVFAGLSAGDYRALLDRAVEDVEAYQLSGAAGSAASGRVAYALGLEGPAVSIDTATSSSLVALHMACASLRLEECSLALVGGVSVLSTPAWFRGFAQQGGLAADGRCKAFGAGADGTVWSEGVGVVVVERLSDALQRGHRVLAVVRGSAVNQDGASGELTAPSGLAQQRVISRALAAAGVAAADVDVVEGHGTGTVAGDPVEAGAVLATYGQDRASPVGLGSVKSNIGHTQAASGLAGLIKTVMALQAETMPATLYADVPSPHVDWSAGRVEVLSQSRPWPPPPDGRPRRAGVSSLGYAGTNAHVVLEQAPPLVPPVVGGPVGAARLTMPVPLVVSAASPAALGAQAARLAEWWRASPDVSLADVGWSLASGRAALDHRAVVVTSDHYMATLGLDALAAGEREAGVLVPGKVTGGGVGFAFSGQGSQRPGMGRALHETFPVFAEAFDEACELLSAELGLAASTTVRDVAWADDEDGRMDQTVFTQASLFAVEVAVARLLGSFGVEPDVVLGHSIGELAAAHVAGVFSLADACRLVAARGRLMQALPAGGAMVALQASADEAAELLAGQEQVALAAVNSPDGVVVSGDESAVVALAERWAASGRRTKRLQVSHAFHSRLMEPMLADFARVAASISYREPELPLVSTVTGAEVSGEVTDPGYWVEQVRRAVRFGDAVRTAATEGVTTLLEVGPGGQLAGLVDANLDDTAFAGAVLGVPVMRPGLDEPASVVMALAAAWARCVTVDFTPLLAGGDTVDLPTYAFQHERFWPTVDPSRVRPRTNGAGGNGSGHRPPETPAAPVATGLAARVAALDESERLRALVEVVRSEAVAVLGDRVRGALDVERTFKDLGFESRDVVELRNGLQEATGLRLPSAVVFDHPTPVALAKELARELAAGPSGPRDAAVPAVAARRIAAPLEAGEPIAIVGMACRFPGGVTSPESLWDLVDGGVDAIEDFPLDRAWASLLDGEVRGSFVRKGGFVAEATQFDAGLFGISPREAMAMDPQQRLLLEVVWEAVERAGMDPTDLHGTDTGVFAGLMNGEYAQLLQSDPGASGVGGVDGLGLTGGLSSVTSGRVAYVLGLEGPAVTVDTACSSSLVALHLACGSLRLGECSLGLVGGVSVLSTPSWFRGFAAQGGLAADGRCKAFGATADGTGWSEGVGVVVVERLSEAQRLGHDVWGVVRGSAINQDGASNGLTAPSGLAQRRVIGRALAAAGVSAADVDVVEAHGTGTVLGDPVEAGAVLATYGQDRASPVGLGSVKSNIGHTQAAAGLAGVMKMVMAMRAGIVPATLHAADPSPHIDWSSGSVELLHQPRAWDTPASRPRRAGVSSFGISGTNAHVILEEASPLASASVDEPPAVVDLRRQRPQLPVPLVVSARSPAALAEYGRRLAKRLADGGGGLVPLVDVGFSLATTRTAMEHRAVVVASSATAGRDLALAGLEALAGGSPVGHLVTGQATAAGGRGPVLVLPGQGAQWAGMAAGLMDEMPVFRRAISECAEAIDPLVDWSLVDVVAGDAGFEDARGRPDVVQPALFAVMVGLSSVWASFGIVPAAVVGHSQGEIAAAFVAGALSLEDAARVVVLRAQLLSRLSGRGGMVSLALAEDAARELISPWSVAEGPDGGRIGVATVNGPSSVTVSGEPGALDELGEACEAASVRWSRVAVDYASHSPQVEAIRDELLSVLADITPKAAAAVPFWSTVTGGVIDDTSALDAAYWYRNLREPVRFAPVVQALAEAGHGLFVEASPHPMLVPAVQATLDSLDSSGPAGHALGTLRRDDGGSMRMVTAVGEAWVHGAAVDWSSLFVGARRVDLPTYPFQRRRYWPSVTPASLSSAGPRLLATEWVALDVPPAVPDTVEQWVVPVSLSGGDDAVAAAGRQAVVETLGRVQSTGADGPLAVVTRGAVALDGDDRSVASGVAAAGVWGLVRAGQSETPGAFVLVDVDLHDDPAALELVPAAVASGEPEVAIRDGRMWGRRLVRSAPTAASASSSAGSVFDPAGAVLITGGTGMLGGLVARHLVAQHGVRRLVLTSRRGPEAPGAAELVAALEKLGAEIDVVAADVADAQAMSAAVQGRDVRGIVHLAGALDDGVVSGLTPERVTTAWASKAGGAWVLHELALGLGSDVSAFVVFSSTAGTLGAAGQANYAAASAFADAVVEHRRALGLPGQSIAWGLWSAASGLTGSMDGAALARMRRTGVVPLATDDALELLDRALSSSGDEAVVAALHLDLGEVAAGPVPPLWRRLAWRPEGRDRLPAAPLSAGESDDAAGGAAADTAEQGSSSRLTKRLEGLRMSERQRVVVDAVRAEAAVVLGYASVDEVAVTRAFKDLGVDSLTAVELRNRLGTLTGLSLETTVVFDHPTVERLAGEIERQLAPLSSSPAASSSSADAVRQQLADLEAMVDELSSASDVALAADLREGLQRALERLSQPSPPSPPDDSGGGTVEDQLSGADAAAVLDFIDREFGRVDPS